MAATNIDPDLRALLEWIFENALDEDKSGFIEEREANRVAKYCGMGGATGDINALWTTMLEMDTDGDERISKEEWVVFMNKSLNGSVAAARELKDRVDAKLNQRDALAQAYTPSAAVMENRALFADLATAPGGCTRIEDTAKRAITLDQLESVVKHTAKRLGCEMEFGHDRGIKINATWKQTRDDGERWLGKRPKGPDGELAEVEVKFNEVNLYDLDKYVIRPATEEKECAMVELMASGEQPPDFFVSHYWAEPILEFFKCLLEHSWARGFESKSGYHNGEEVNGRNGNVHPLYLGGRPPHYWVCAYANNQWTLASELVEDLAETSFARAMRISMGTVSVVDRSAGCFGRIWCVYELSYSVSREDKKEFMYDIVTAKEWDRYGNTHGAVAITDGMSAQRDDASMKLMQEEAFPLELIDKGIAFKCVDCKASFEADKVRILKAIGDGSETLDAKVHGVVACAALKRALEEGGTRRETFLEAVRNGHVRKLQLSLEGSAADTAETWSEVVGALDATAMEELSMQTAGGVSGFELWQAHRPCLD